MLIVDSHEDLAYNVLTFGRDYTRSAAETRRREAGTYVPDANGDTLLGWPDYQRGQVGLIFATLFAAPTRKVRHPEWDKLSYEDVPQARQVYRRQADVYHRLVEEYPDLFRLVQTQTDLQSVLERWQANPHPWPEPNPEAETKPGAQPAEEEAQNPAGNPVGLVMLMEGAEAVGEPAELEEWWALGLRLIGPCWAGTRFAGGTREPGPLTKDGYALLGAMGDLGFGLDLSHMDEEAALQALDIYPGAIAASHANAKRLLKEVDSNRFLTDRLIQGLVERNGVIGVVPYNNFLIPGWRRGDRRQASSLGHMIAHIDHICQMAGDARHVGLGTDFDGGFGVQSTPPEIDTIADLQKIAPALVERGYNEQDIAAILGGNWIDFIKRILPEHE